MAYAPEEILELAAIGKTEMENNEMTSGNRKNGNSVRWIIALCLTAALAVVGWTTTANLSMRLKTIEDLKTSTVRIEAITTSNNIRISVLEGKYDMIQATLVEIKVLIQKYMEQK